MLAHLPSMEKRVPKEEWHEKPFGTDILYSRNKNGWAEISLPNSLTAEEVAIILWAFERGFESGRGAGKEELTRDFKRLFRMDGF